MTHRKEPRDLHAQMSDNSSFFQPHYYLACHIAMNLALLNLVDALTSNVRSSGISLGTVDS